MLNKVFHFDSPREKYTCDAVVIWCFDNRFNLAFSKFLKRKGIANIDPVKVAGGAKCLASPENQGEQDFVIEQIRKSVRLHSTKLVILMVHSDCGAYGGLHAFKDDPTVEGDHHELELVKAAEVLKKRLRGLNLEIEGYYANFEGIFQTGIALS